VNEYVKACLPDWRAEHERSTGGGGGEGGGEFEVLSHLEAVTDSALEPEAGAYSRSLFSSS